MTSVPRNHNVLIQSLAGKLLFLEAVQIGERMRTSQRDCLKQMLLGGPSLAPVPYIVDGQKVEEGAKLESLKSPITATHEQRIAWWREARSGMFLHFGLYSRMQSRSEV